MHYEIRPSLEVAGSESEQAREALLLEVESLAAETGAELSEDELRACAYGINPDSEEESWAPFKVGERAARLSLRAGDADEPSAERRLFGAQSAALSAAGCMRAAPEAARELLAYARAVWSGERLWQAKDMPKFEPREDDTSAGEERKAA